MRHYHKGSKGVYMKDASTRDGILQQLYVVGDNKSLLKIPRLARRPFAILSASPNVHSSCCLSYTIITKYYFPSDILHSW